MSHLKVRPTKRHGPPGKAALHKQWKEWRHKVAATRMFRLIIAGDGAGAGEVRVFFHGFRQKAADAGTARPRDQSAFRRMPRGGSLQGWSDPFRQAKTKMPGFPTRTVGTPRNWGKARRYTKREASTQHFKIGLVKRAQSEERFLSSQADVSQERSARKSRPAPFEMTCGVGGDYVGPKGPTHKTGGALQSRKRRQALPAAGRRRTPKAPATGRGRYT
jgi:hypothetical protein